MRKCSETAEQTADFSVSPQTGSQPIGEEAGLRSGGGIPLPSATALVELTLTWRNVLLCVFSHHALRADRVGGVCGWEGAGLSRRR